MISIQHHIWGILNFGAVTLPHMPMVPCRGFEFLIWRVFSRWVSDLRTSLEVINDWNIPGTILYTDSRWLWRRGSQGWESQRGCMSLAIFRWSYLGRFDTNQGYRMTLAYGERQQRKIFGNSQATTCLHISARSIETRCLSPWTSNKTKAGRSFFDLSKMPTWCQ